MCGRCGNALPKTPSKTTGQPIISRCATCRRKNNETVRAYNERMRAQKAEAKRMLRKAEAAIEIRRIQEARIAAGLPISNAANPKLPKDTPVPREEL